MKGSGITCSAAKAMVGCSHDLHASFPKMPAGSLVSSICRKTCNACNAGSTRAGSVTKKVGGGAAVLAPKDLLSMQPVYAYTCHPQKVDFTTALKSCRSRGQDLASIHSHAAQTTILQKFPQCNLAWIGLTDVAQENTWKWTDGTAFDFHEWNKGEPNNYDGNEDYVQTSRTGWNDLPANFKHPYLCATISWSVPGDPSKCQATWQSSERNSKGQRFTLCRLPPSKGWTKGQVGNGGRNDASVARYVSLCQSAGAHPIGCGTNQWLCQNNGCIEMPNSWGCNIGTKTRSHTGWHNILGTFTNMAKTREAMYTDSAYPTPGQMLSPVCAILN
jgi:hypothetical protein|eukprot:COSAG01_NODE_324_length_18846_cov_60.042193_2_plen_331_part_00